MSLSNKVLLGLGAGVAVGLVIGERAKSLELWADAYIGLLQMTVLPYVTISLVGGLGSLSRTEAGRLGWRVTIILVGLWAVALVAVFAFPLMFPVTQTSSFFSTTLLEDRPPLDLIGLYIPANPFNSLANNVVPAVVLFSALLGIALIGVPNKAPTLETLDVLNQAVGRVARFIVSLTPYGLFAIAVVIAGTFDPSQAAQLEMYLAAYIVMALLLSFWVLPGIVAALTPVPHRVVLARTRDALIMAFATGSLFVVLPMLAEETRTMLREYTKIGEHDERLPDIIIPASFNFPHTAKLLSLSFILFAAWFSGESLARSHYAALAGTGILVLFGSLNVAVPFLLDMFRIPADAFQMFLATSVINSRFGTMLSAVHTVTIAVVGTCAVAGAIRFQPRRLLRFGVITLALGIATIAGTRQFAARMAGHPYDKDRILGGMQASRDRGNAQVLWGAAPPLPAFAGSVLDRMHSRGVLRVAYFDDSLPYVFTNAKGDLVGFDVEMAQQLAHDLGIKLELVTADRTIFNRGLDAAAADLVMSGAAITSDRALRVLFSTPYLDETVAFIVLDNRRSEFATWDGIQAMPALRLGVPRATYYMDKVRAQLPQAEIVEFDSMTAMFESHDGLDALIATAERGSIYTLLHPEYAVAIPKPRPLKVPLGYVIAGRDAALATAVNTWIDLKRKDGTIDELFDHWILGRNAVPHRRRWSVVDDVLK
jgi:Na+/H+-dicarboxylate symporter